MFWVSLLVSVLVVAQGGKALTVAQDGSGDFRAVQAALDALPAAGGEIRIKPGVYREVLHIRKDNVHLRGDNGVVLIFGNHSGLRLPTGDTVNTWTSASCFIDGDDFRAENITFENDAGFTAGQAVAVMENGNRAAFFHCRLIGNQDVLFCSGPGTKQYYEDCYIEGSTDFIFGPATAVFNKCHIHSKKNSHVTAASTPREIPYGFVFFDCRLTADTNIHKVSLGRPWQPYASVTYIRCWMGSHIIPEGWNNWKNPDNEKTARFAEYGSTGPGASPSTRAPWSRQLTAAALVTIAAVLGDWRPS